MIRWTRSIARLTAIALLVPTLALAAPTPPDQLAKQTVQKVLSDMNGHRPELRNDPQKLYKLIDRDLVPLLDLRYMSQLVLGRYWRQASPEQRKRFQVAFKNMLVRTYGSALLGFNDDVKIDYLPVRAPDDAKEVTFNAIVKGTGSEPDTRISLKMHLVDGQWKVYDGSVGNLSFVTNYRGQFSSEIRRNGLESLIDKMEQRYNSK
ncbi:MAG: ABC transporter substrate-binding protein [Salinisphaera sp.]|jgi:phospholipid transport system substrate-binding protein|nr:ABC transporter substrate-binding protein [Salinisphaera sp.]